MLQRPATIGNVAKRSLAATAHATKPVAKSNPPKEAVVKTSRAPSGLLVTSIDRHGTLSNIAMGYRAGSRYESPSSLGVSHRVRNMIGLSSKEHSAFELLWRSGVLGGDVTTYTSRDLLVATLQTWRDHAVPAMELLGQLTSPGLRTWELEDTHQQMKIERALMKQNPAMRLAELLHAAAYRSGPLANSVVSPGYMIGKHNVGMVGQFVSSQLVASEACLVGVNVDHDQLLAYAQVAPIETGGASSLKPSPYYGGELRKQSGHPLAHVLFAGASQGLNDAKAAATAAVFGALMASPIVDHATHAGVGKAATAVSGVASGVHGVTPFHSLNADSGLVGVYVVAEPDSIDGVVRAAVNAIKESGTTVTDGDLQRAKQTALTLALLQADRNDSIVEDAISQTLSGQAVATNSDALNKAISAVTATDVQALAKQIVGKPTLAALGPVDGVPYLDSL